MNRKLLRLVESAVMIALASVLSLITPFKMPLGGSITLCSMLPIMLIAYKYRFKWGVLTAFTYSVIQLLLDVGKLSSWGLTAYSFVGSMFFDYLIAFTCLSIVGLFGKGFVRYIIGMVVAVLARFISHVISGVIFFASSTPKGWANPFIYSIAYNASFLFPDLAICLIVGALVYKPLKKFLE